MEQTKVSKSLAYDLFALARTRSPQKTCHNIAVALDRDKESPFHQRIKRLGVATPGRSFETLTQAQFVEGVLRYISKNPKQDRDALLRGERLELIDSEESQKLVFRNLFVREEDILIAKIVRNYFDAVRVRWPEAWDYRGTGLILNRTNGFRALIRLFRDVYVSVAAPGDLVEPDVFLELFKRSTLADAEFSRDTFAPGSSGEGLLYQTLKSQILH